MTVTSVPLTARHGAVPGAAVRRFMRRWATGVAVVTSVAAQQSVGCTVNAFTSVSLDPPLLLVSLASTSRTLAAVVGYGAFGINLLGQRQSRVADSFAVTGGDRFRDVPFQMVYGVPVLDGAIAATVCVLDSCLPVADHVLVLGTPRWCTQRGEDSDDARPMVLFAGQYLTTAVAGGTGAQPA